MKSHLVFVIQILKSIHSVPPVGFVIEPVPMWTTVILCVAVVDTIPSGFDAPKDVTVNSIGAVMSYVTSVFSMNG